MDDGRSIPKHCAGTRRDGAPCQGPVLDGGAYCFAHDPKRAAERQAARQKGGHHRGAVVRLHRLVPPRLLPVYDQLEAALGEVHAGTLDPKQAVAMAALARAMIAVLTAGELEERVRGLEGRAAR
jgi:hypothetical protein